MVPGDEKKWAVKKEGEEDPVYTTDDRKKLLMKPKRVKEAGKK